MKIIHPSLGTSLKAARKRKNFSQAALAKACGVSQNAVQQIETGGTVKPSYDLVQKLAATLEIPISALIGEPPGLGTSVEHLAEKEVWLGDSVETVPSVSIWKDIQSQYRSADEERRAEIRVALKNLFLEKAPEIFKRLGIPQKPRK